MLNFPSKGSDYYPWQYGVYKNFPIAKDGKVQVPEGPGWGVEICEGWLEKSSYQQSLADDAAYQRPPLVPMPGPIATVV